MTGEADDLRDLTSSPRRSTICAVVVTFHADAGFRSRVAELRSQVGWVVIVDNASGATARAMLRDLAAWDKVTLVENAQNLGIATALNQGFAEAKGRGFEWVVTFDQDTSVAPGLVEGYARVCDALEPHELARMGMLGMNHIDSNTGEVYVRALHVTAPYVERKTVITSGTLMSTRAYDRIGLFREEFFIDSVDHDYSLRARAKGYTVLLALDPLLRHAMGNRKVRRILPGISFQTVNYPPFRWYYIVHNRIAVATEHVQREPAWAVARMVKLFAQAAGTVLFETERVEKARCMLLGAADLVLRRQPRRPSDLVRRPRSSVDG